MPYSSPKTTYASTVRKSGTGESDGVIKLLAWLGNLLYWLCTGVAVVLVLAGVYSVIFGQAEHFGAVVVGAIVLWGIGRLVRYVLAGK